MTCEFHWTTAVAESARSWRIGPNQSSFKTKSCSTLPPKCNLGFFCWADSILHSHGPPARPGLHHRRPPRFGNLQLPPTIPSRRSTVRFSFLWITCSGSATQLVPFPTSGVSLCSSRFHYHKSTGTPPAKLVEEEDHLDKTEGFATALFRCALEY